MSAPVRVQLSRKKGLRMPPNTICVSRPGRWGNPFLVKEFGRDLSVMLYARSITGYWNPNGVPDEKISSAYAIHSALQKHVIKHGMSVASLRGYNLACWCPLDKPCHADALLEIANR